MIAIKVPVIFQKASSTVITTTTEDGAWKGKVFVWEESTFPQRCHLENLDNPKTLLRLGAVIGNPENGAIDIRLAQMGA